MSNKVNVNQPLTNIVKIASIGPQGPAGIQGPSGSQGAPGISDINTGSLGDTTITGSLTVSGSETLTNIGPFSQTGISTFDGNITLSGSLTVSGSGGVITSGDTGSFVTNSQTGSFITNSQTGSFLTGNDTGSFVTNSQTGSFVTNSQTGSFITNSQTSSMTILSSSFATTASFISSTFISSSAAASGFGTGGGGSTIDTGSLGSTTITGSLTVSGSNTFTNIGPFSQTGNSTFDGNSSQPAVIISGSQETNFGENSPTDKLRIGGNLGESFTFKYNTSTSGFSFVSPMLQISGSGGSSSFNPNIILGSTDLASGGAIGDNVIAPFNLFVGSRFIAPDGQSNTKSKYQFLVSGSDGNAGGGVISLGKHGIDPSGSSDIFLNGHVQAAGHITASGNISASATSTASFGTYVGDGSQLTGISAGSSIDTGSLGSTTITGSLIVSGSGTLTNIGPFSQTGDSTFTGDITASANISLPTNASSIKFNSAELHGRVGGSYPGLTINSGVSSGDRIWLRDSMSTTGPVTMSFIGVGKIDGVQSIEGQGNRALILRGGAGPNDANDGVQMFTGDASNVYQQRFAIEADGTNVDAYFTNINGLGINDDTPSATLDVNGNINTTSHITASGNISSSGNITALDLNLFGGDIDLKNAGAQSNIKFYCESANAHYTKLQAAPHSAYSGNPTVTLPAYAFDFATPYFQSNITASGNISSSAASTASFGTYIGDGSGITGIISSSYALTASHALNAGGGSGAGFPFTGDAVITGSLIISASATSQSLSVIGSGSTQFDVIGSVGTLFSVDDSLTGTLFSANDISGFPVLQAESTGEVYLGKSPQSLYTTAVVSSTTAATTHSLVSLSTSSYDGAFFEYTALSSSNARAGSIMSVWNGANIVSTETTSSQIGNTTDLTAEVIISQSQAQLVVYGANASYKVKTIIKAI